MTIGTKIMYSKVLNYLWIDLEEHKSSELVRTGKMSYKTIHVVDGMC